LLAKAEEDKDFNAKYSELQKQRETALKASAEGKFLDKYEKKHDNHDSKKKKEGKDQHDKSPNLG